MKAPVFTLSLLTLLTGLPSCHKPSPTVSSAEAAAPSAPPAKPITIKTARSEKRAMPRYLRVTGQLQAAWDALVAADAAGKVETTPVERGTQVRQGDALVRLDERLARMSLREAEATVALAKAQAELSASELQRNQPLAESKAIAPADFKRLSTDNAAKESQLAAAEARRDMAQKALQDAIIPAPFEGIVAERLVSPGEYVRPGQPVARVVQTTTLRLVVNVSESAVGRIQEGQRIEFSVAAYPGVTFQGKVNHLGSTLRESSRDLLVEAAVENADGRLKPGLFAEARLVTGDEQALAVPQEALRIEGTRRKLYVPRENRLEERLVEVGESRDGWVEIRQGLAEGESVMLKPGAEAADGVAVNLQP